MRTQDTQERHDSRKRRIESSKRYAKQERKQDLRLMRDALRRSI